jgi:hypothetical protein
MRLDYIPHLIILQVFLYNQFMEVKIDKYLWEYLSQPQKDLINQGKFIIEEIIEEGKYNFDDYCFVVFPFAKAYEGFLKQLLLDVGFITAEEYNSDHFRLGKVLSPNLELKLGNRSVYRKICNNANYQLSDDIWEAWKIGRNQVFHYFPHNIKSLTFEEASRIIQMLIDTMEKAVLDLKINMVKTKLKGLI